MYNNVKNKWLRKVLVAAIWLVIWQIVSLCVDNSILLVGPIETLIVLLEKIAEISFWKTVLMSMARIVAGFLAGWDETEDYEHAFKMAVCAGSASAFSELYATKEEVEQLYQQMN